MNPKIVVILGVAGVLLIAFAFWFFPVYGVWQKELAGKAQLREAEWNRQIKIREAEADKESAVLNAEAKILREKGNAQSEIERAKGVAEANEIIGNSLKGNDEYIKYLWVQGLHDGNSEVIYVPVESNLPLLEAGRFGR